jgi:hypothetical protein
MLIKSLRKLILILFLSKEEKQTWNFFLDDRKITKALRSYNVCLVCRQNSVCAIMSVLVDISFCNIKHNNIWHWIKVYLDLGYFNFTRIQTRGPNVQKLMNLLFVHEEFIWSVYAYHLYTFLFWCTLWCRNYLPFQSTWVHPRF